MEFVDVGSALVTDFRYVSNSDDTETRGLCLSFLSAGRGRHKLGPTERSASATCKRGDWGIHTKFRPQLPFLVEGAAATRSSRCVPSLLPPASIFLLAILLPFNKPHYTLAFAFWDSTARRPELTENDLRFCTSVCTLPVPSV